MSPAGLIPAHAGKTYRDPMGRRVYWAHPRSRGENLMQARVRVVRVGSSPLTRGKRYAYTMHGYLPGLIPAHAGKTTGELQSALTLWAHPRSRGENSRKRLA